jgi:hypothetical protein
LRTKDSESLIINDESLNKQIITAGNSDNVQFEQIIWKIIVNTMTMLHWIPTIIIVLISKGSIDTIQYEKKKRWFQVSFIQ